MANISKTLNEDLLEFGYHFNLFDPYMNRCEAIEATEISVFSFDEENYFMQSFKLPKAKEVNIEWVMTKVNTEKIYESFTNDFKRILKHEFGGRYNWLSVYPTTYGIGVWVMASFRKDIAEIKQGLESVLEKYGIEYRNEYSGAGWVFRYVISKRKENIEKLSRIP